MNKLIIIPLTFFLIFNAYARGSNTTIQIIMDDSGVLIDTLEADQYKMKMLSDLKYLIRKREFANAHIDVIGSSLGRTKWSGKPIDLKRKPKRALALVESIKSAPENCNNLPGSFIELKSNLRALERQGFRHAHVVVFSSLIHTPRPCNEKTSIILPQAPPAEGNINSTLTSSGLVRSISWYWVSPHQKNVWEEFLEPTFNWALTNSVPMKFLDIERSKVSLEQGLKLEGQQ